MAAFIHNIATVVPEQIYQQDFLREKMKEYITDDRAIRSIIHRIYSQSGIEKRHSVVNDFNANGDPRLFFREDGTLNAPSTGTRNEMYSEYARNFFVELAQSLLDGHPEVQKEDITHVITVSCTGFFAPGPDFEIVKKLSLSPSAQRFHLGFMGCYAAFPALKMAKAFCESQKDAVVMVICLELCTLHLQNSEQTDHLISASVFSDGGAGVLVSSSRPETDKPFLQLTDFTTSIVEQSEQDMAWSIGDTGFDMILSTYIPDIIEANLKNAVQPLLENYQLDRSEINHWAIHPGGRAILDKIEKSLEIRPEQLASSRAVLSGFGNMSSATILFVLKHLLDQPVESQSERVLAMAFGPGLTIESGLFQKIQT